MPLTVKCPICGRKTDSLNSAVKNGKYVSERCDKCLANNASYADYARKYERDSQRRKFGRDLVQKYEGDKINEEYVKSYPEKSKQLWGDSVVRDMGVKRKQF